MRRYKMTLKVLSPVHIGSGQELDPLEYVVKQGRFYRLDLIAFLNSLTDDLRQRFREATREPNPTRLRQFIMENANLDKQTLFVADAAEPFAKAYERSLGNPRNQLLVNLMIRTGTDCLPYIPGSSIKGAIRTAIVSCLAKKTRQVVNARRFENEVLGHSDGKQDPFRCVKIADAMLPRDATFIDSVEIFNPLARSGPNPAGIQMFYEQCFSLLDREDVRATTVFEIDDLLPQKDYLDRRRGIRGQAVSMPLSVEQIVESCQTFYGPKITTDHTNFYRSNPRLEACNQPLLNERFAGGEFPIRLGRFSHIECTTVDGLRKPGGAAARRGFGKTRTLSGGEMTMGWVKVTLKSLS